MNKKIYIIIIGLIIIYIILLLVGFALKKTQVDGELSMSIKTLVTDRVFFPALYTDRQSIIYYTSGEQNKFQRYDLESGNIDDININIGQPEILKWSPTKNEVIFAIRYYSAFYDRTSPLYVEGFEDGEFVFYLLNIEDGQIKNLGLAVWDAAFINDEQIIFYQNSYIDGLDQLSVCDYQLVNCQQKVDLSMDEGINFYNYRDDILIKQHLPELGNAPIYQLKLPSLELTPFFNLEASGVIAIPNSENILINQITPFNKFRTYVVDGATGSTQQLNRILDLENTAFSMDSTYAFSFSLDENDLELLETSMESKTISRVVVDSTHQFRQPKNLFLDQTNNLFFTDLDALLRLSK